MYCPFKIMFFNAQVGSYFSVQGRFIINLIGKSISIADHVTFISSTEEIAGLSSPVADSQQRISIGAHSGFSSVALSSRHSTQIESIKMGGNVEYMITIIIR